VETTLLPLALTLAADPVPNVRFNVAKCFEAIAPDLSKLDQTLLQDKVKPCLTTMCADTDDDVKFYAGRALNAM
jgi:serine/threonine-protein phosphatase 2A regulatory subunit A